MGNTALCKSTPCTTNPKPVYKTILSQIFQIALEKSVSDASTNKSFNADTSETTIKLPSDNVDVPRLEAHVKSHIKGLIDYLEGSHKKLIDTGAYLNKVITGSFNPNIHMLGLLTIIELLSASSKFSHNADFLTKLRQRGKNDTEEIGKDSSASKINQDQNKGFDSSLYEDNIYQDFKDNIVQFENHVIEIVIYLLDSKIDNLRKKKVLLVTNFSLEKPVFKHILKTFGLYIANQVKNVPLDKLELIIDRLLTMVEPYQTFGNKEGNFV